MLHLTPKLSIKPLTNTYLYKKVEITNNNFNGMSDRLERVGVEFALERGIFTWKRFGKGQSCKREGTKLKRE